MFSKLVKPTFGMTCKLLVPRSPQQVRPRTIWGVPPTQYDMAIPKKLHIGYALSVFWELTPVVFVTVFSLSLMCTSIAWASVNKVDTVFSTHNRENISRTMDLRNPTTHKMVIINQQYEPWLQMQNVLDKMVEAEKRYLNRLDSCGHP